VPFQSSARLNNDVVTFAKANLLAAAHVLGERQLGIAETSWEQVGGRVCGEPVPKKWVGARVSVSVISVTNHA
jgi:hypothetical protein